MTEDDSRREETLSQLCLEAHQEFKNGSYRKALSIYTDIKNKLDTSELTDNWIIIKQMGLCEYRLNHKKKACPRCSPECLLLDFLFDDTCKDLAWKIL